MCNQLHGNFKPIKKTGFGFKVFAYNPYARKHFFKPMFPDGKESFKSVELNKWDKKFNYRGGGFCFFLTEQGARNFLYGRCASSKPRVIHKIKYRRGLGKMKHFGSGTYSLCKEFYILEEV